MNKKAVELSITQLIGFVIVAVIFLGTIGLVMKIVGIMAEKPDEATINSFKNLMHEINTIEEGQIKVVPYYIAEGLYLRTECETNLILDRIGDDICICKDSCMKKRVTRLFHKNKIIIHLNSPGHITYDKTKEVNNVALIRTGEGICINEDETITTCTI
jgi:hypothetical protein